MKKFDSLQDAKAAARVAKKALGLSVVHVAFDGMDWVVLVGKFNSDNYMLINKV